MIALAMPGTVTQAQRVVVASAMKTGSTYVATVLRRYLRCDVGNRDLAIWWAAEQNLTADVIAQLDGRSFVVQMHLRPHPTNLTACSVHNIAVFVQWRNLGDAIVSFDDHILNEGPLNPVCYVHDRNRYLELSDEQRYDFLIRNAVPWYLAFYLSWRREARRFFRYESMVANPIRFFSEMFSELNESVDERRLAEVLADRDGARFNVGIVGRSATRFTEQNRRALEEQILQHPERAELEVLLWELPWMVPDLTPSGPWDGRIVRSRGDAALWFLSRGVRHWLEHPSWMASHPQVSDQPIVDLDRMELDGIPVGSSIL